VTRVTLAFSSSILDGRSAAPRFEVVAHEMRIDPQKNILFRSGRPPSHSATLLTNTGAAHAAA
jgi:hypothetical protein